MKLKMLMAAVTMLAVTGAYAQFGLGDILKKPEIKKEEVKKDDVKASGASTALPFGVKLGGQQAVAKGDATFATVDQPVADVMRQFFSLTGRWQHPPGSRLS